MAARKSDRLDMTVLDQPPGGVGRYPHPAGGFADGEPDIACRVRLHMLYIEQSLSKCQQPGADSYWSFRAICVIMDI